jgi:fructose-1,6-bisphosphatase I
MVSEEDEKPMEVDIKNSGKYVVTFDPLDGSSNIDCNVSVGTIFGIWKRHTKVGEPVKDYDYLRNGNDIICSGYCVYGSAVLLILATGPG